MNKMTNVSLRIWKTVLSFLGAFLGFSSVVVAQYGVIETSYVINGKLMDACEEPLSGIHVEMEVKSPWNDQSQIIDEQITDSLGAFSFYFYDHYYEKGVIIRAEDENRQVKDRMKDTLFLIPSERLEFSSKERGSWHNNYTLEDPLSLTMQFKDGRKCREEEGPAPVTEEPENDSVMTSVVLEEIIPEVYDNEERLDSVPDVNSAVTPLTEQSDWINVYPNPTTGLFYIEFDAPEMMEVRLRMFDAEMKLIWEENKHLVSGVEKEILDISQYATGVYFLHIIKPTATEVYRVIKASR